MSNPIADEYRESLARTRAKHPEIGFYHEPDASFPWRCSIRLSDGEYHGGEGQSQCEALILASIHWAMHGSVK